MCKCSGMTMLEEDMMKYTVHTITVNLITNRLVPICIQYHEWYCCGIIYW